MDKENNSGIQIDGCTFSGNGTAVSVPKGSKLNIKNTSMVSNGVGLEIRDSVGSLFENLKTEVLASNLDTSLKERVIKQIIETINSKKFPEDKKNIILSILKYTSGKAVDLFIQIVANYVTK